MEEDSAARLDFRRDSVRFVDAFRVKTMPKTVSVARVAVMRQMLRMRAWEQFEAPVRYRRVV